MNTKVAKKNNKGFTLIELIVVIAIIAVLAAILAPQYLRYVEKSRISADVSTASEIRSAVQTACANEDAYAALKENEKVVWTGSGKTGGKITVDGQNLSETSKDALNKEIAVTFGGNNIPGMKSKVWQKTFGKGYTITIRVDETNQSVKLDYPADPS